MKTIGLIGGTSWSSTLDYYRFINEETAKRLGGFHSAKLVLVSIDFAELEGAMHSGRWDDAAALLAGEAKKLENAGADGVMLCSNLIHKLFDKVQGSTKLPMIHIADAVAEEICARGYKTVALLGAMPTMEESFYARRIEEKSGARVVVPSLKDRTYIDAAIFERMCKDVFIEEDRNRFKGIIKGLKERGAEAVILGCTELPILLKEAALPLLNSTELHSKKAVRWALGLT